MTAEQIHAALMNLPIRQRACLVLMRRDHMQEDEIANAIGISVDEVHAAVVAALYTLTMLDRQLRGKQ